MLRWNRNVMGRCKAWSKFKEPCMAGKDLYARFTYAKILPCYGKLPDNSTERREKITPSS